MGYALRRIRLPQGMATLPWNARQVYDGIDGNFGVESMATFARNTQWCEE